MQQRPFAFWTILAIGLEKLLAIHCFSVRNMHGLRHGSKHNLPVSMIFFFLLFILFYFWQLIFRLLISPFTSKMKVCFIYEKSLYRPVYNGTK